MFRRSARFFINASGALSAPAAAAASSLSSSQGVAAHEVDKFRQLHDQWWSPLGALRTLHQLNPTRVRYIETMACAHFDSSASNNASNIIPSLGALAGRCVLDIGSGGGLLSESLARRGADVFGVDACAESISVAEAHAAQVDPTGQLKLRYECVNIFDLGPNAKTSSNSSINEGDDVKASPTTPPPHHKDQYDIVIASEVLEHVDEPAEFFAQVCSLAKPDGGIVIISTLDKSFMTALVHVGLAEYVTGLVPRGTHDWRRFLPPADITRHALRHSVVKIDESHLMAIPDPAETLATGSLALRFATTHSANTGHYFWTGIKH